MKIKRLIISEYKNVAVNVELQAELITLLVGQNGMGKSNLLEILLLIFDELFLFVQGKKPRKEENLKFDYTLEFECRGRYFRVVKEEKNHYCWNLQTNDDGEVNAQEIDIRNLVLPSQIVGYYSGENKRIRALIAKHIKREESSKRRRYSKGTIGELEPKKLFFADNRHSLLILTTLLLYQDHPTYSGNIRKVLQDVVHVGSWDRIYLRFRNPSFAKMGELRKQGLTLKDYQERLLQGEDLEETNIFWGIRGNVDKLLRLLLYYALDYGHRFSIFPANRGTREIFDIESIPIERKFRDLLFERFPNPMFFLNTLEECFVLNMVENLDIILRKSGEKSFYPYLHLSEGEQQYLTVMGLIALSHSSHDETLFLLDEPDTHINPQWQRGYIKQIKEMSSLEENKKSKAFFISTHSPLLVQANSPGNPDVDLLLFKKDENGQVKIDTDEEMWENWRIDQVLLSKYFDLPSSRPTALDEFMKRRSETIQGAKESEVRNKLSNYTDAFGFLPTGESLADVEAMAYIHKIANRLKKETGR